MGVLRRVELSGMLDGRRAVRLVHGAGEASAFYREGSGSGEALLALRQDGGPWEELALALADRGVGSLLLDATDEERTGLQAALDFLGQRGVTRVVLSGEGRVGVLATTAVRGAAGLALVLPSSLAWPRIPARGTHGEGRASSATRLWREAPMTEVARVDLPVLIVVDAALEMPGRRLAAQMGRCEVVRVGGRDDPELVSVLRTFTVDALTGGRCAIGG